MAMRIKWDGLCCTNCLLIAGCGECGTAEESDQHHARMMDHLGPDFLGMVLTGNDADTEGEFRWSHVCEACGDSFAGQRFPFAILEPAD